MYNLTSSNVRLKDVIKWVVMISFTLFISACGTVTSLSHSDIELKNKLNQTKTLCTKTTRVYGGIAYDFCQIHAKASQPYSAVKTSYYLFDMIPSFIADSLVLPYTVFEQCNKGSLSTESPYP